MFQRAFILKLMRSQRIFADEKRREKSYAGIYEMSPIVRWSCEIRRERNAEVTSFFLRHRQVVLSNSIQYNEGQTPGLN